MRNKRWKTALLGLITAAACILSGCASSASAIEKAGTVKPVDAYLQTPTMLIDDSGEYSGSGTWSDFKEYTIPASSVGGSFNEGDMFQLDCDVKGSGVLTNYFYGNNGYRQVAYWYSPTTGQSSSTATDGSNQVTLTSEYKHYCVRFTLGSKGDGSVAKKVLFRLYGGNYSASVRNVQFRKYSEVFAGWSTLPDGTKDGAVWYQAGDKAPNDRDLDLYAQWTDKYNDFGYTGSVQVYTVPTDGVYQLECWGGQGGTDSKDCHGGYGAYAVGNVSLKRGQKLYVQVGGEGYGGRTDVTAWAGSYPNGGATNASISHIASSAGGGSTNILLTSTDLKNTDKANILLVAAGGGGVNSYWGKGSDGGNGGGIEGGATADNYEGINATGGTQTAGGLGGGNNNGRARTDSTWLGGAFGEGSATSLHQNNMSVSGGGGGGYYGGGASWGGSGAGGSSYIGNSLLTDKHMAGYGVTTSDAEDTKTLSVNATSGTPAADKAKTGDGYARITLVSLD